MEVVFVHPVVSLSDVYVDIDVAVNCGC